MRVWRHMEGGTEKRAAIFIGPEFGTCWTSQSHRGRRWVAGAIRAIVKHVPAIRRLPWVQAMWRR